MFLMLVVAASAACSEEGSEPEPASLEEREAPCVELQPATDCGTITRAEGCENLDAYSPREDLACRAEDTTDAVTECALSSLASGTPFVFSIDTVVVKEWISAPTFAVAADGSGWTRTDDFDSICSYHGVETRAPTSFDGCTEIDCLVERLEAAPPALECSDYTVCDE